MYIKIVIYKKSSTSEYHYFRLEKSWRNIEKFLEILKYFHILFLEHYLH